MSTRKEAEYSLQQAKNELNKGSWETALAFAAIGQGYATLALSEGMPDPQVYESIHTRLSDIGESFVMLRGELGGRR